MHPSWVVSTPIFRKYTRGVLNIHAILALFHILLHLESSIHFIVSANAKFKARRDFSPRYTIHLPNTIKSTDPIGFRSKIAPIKLGSFTLVLPPNIRNSRTFNGSNFQFMHRGLLQFLRPVSGAGYVSFDPFLIFTQQFQQIKLSRKLQMTNQNIWSASWKNLASCRIICITNRGPDTQKDNKVKTKNFIAESY